MLAQFLAPLFASKFGTDAFSTGENPLFIFAPACPEVGELRVFEAGVEARVHIGDLTHGHFYSFGEYETPEESAQELAENLFDFICDVFEDKFVFWRAKSGAQGGWFSYDDASEPIDLPVYADKADWFFWSRPIEDVEAL